MMRTFTRTQRITIYLRARGRCQRCGAQLEPGWHCDHVIPWSRGGTTTIDNGQALCAACNQAKGSRMDQIELRAWQQRMLEVVLDGIDQGRRETLVMAQPGLGKTLGAQNVAIGLYRRGFIDKVVYYCPRTNLAEQGQKSWMH